MHRLFTENTLARHMFGGSAWLVLGVPVSGGLLYKEEFDCMMRNGKSYAHSSLLISTTCNVDLILVSCYPFRTQLYP